jgi:3-oxoacyl-[acyl-carrier protein] reductase
MNERNGKGGLAGLNALITGGGTGIGKGIALEFAAQGADIAITGRRIEPLEEVAAEIRKIGRKCVTIAGDVGKAADAARMVRETVGGLGGLQILVNNAGIARFGPLDQTPDEDIAAMVNANLIGLLNVTKAAIPELVKHGGRASIVNIASSVADKPVKYFSVYSATKAAVVHASRCLALDLAEQRVRVNCVNPGPNFGTTMTPEAADEALKQYAQMTPLGRVGQPRDIASAALFLARPDNDWMTGAVLIIDGGIALT